jgi:cystathionine gamma-synthase
VVGYEEGDAAITQHLTCGYPRFVYHPYVLQLMTFVTTTSNTRDKDCLLLPSAQAAARCRAFLQRALERTVQAEDTCSLEGNEIQQSQSQHQQSAISIQHVHGTMHAVLFPAQTTAGMEAKAYWQHTGEVVSSRRALDALLALKAPIQRHVSTTNTGNDPADSANTTIDATTTNSDYTAAISNLRTRIGDLARVPRDNVALTPSGMAAIYGALRSARRRAQHYGNATGGTAIVYGFPYLDTLKLCSRQELVPGGVEFFGNAHDLRSLEALLRKSKRNNNNNNKQYCALFTEVPSNPLLQCPDLVRLRELADEYDFMLILDDTIANFLNVDLLHSGLADAVCTSLTKSVSGRGDAMAGSVIANPNTVRGRWMQQDLNKHVDLSGGLYPPDAAVILHNSRDFYQRNATINANAERLADWLDAHPDVQTVYYPKLSAPLYKQVQSERGGYGGLLSMVLHPHMCQRTFFDALDVAKGPSLGTDFTLVCPYTLLAHYHELDFAMSYNVPPNLLRVAVGLEAYVQLQAKFEVAFTRARLYPKPSAAQKRAYSTVTGTLSRAFCLPRRCGLQRSFWMVP